MQVFTEVKRVMFQHKKISSLDDYFLDLSKRENNSVYFYRIADYTDTVKAFLLKYYNSARLNGVIIEGGIPNPNENNLSYYYEMIGDAYKTDCSFINEQLRKWLPRMTDNQRNIVSTSIYDTLISLKNSGKNENMLKNAYIKFMCWLYYKFERIANKLGNTDIPKILYEGIPGKYELLLLTVLSKAGCDIIMLEYSGDADYIKNDPNSEFSDKYTADNSVGFPDGFSLKALQKEIAKQYNAERAFGTAPKLQSCVNSWAKGEGLLDALTPLNTRGSSETSYNTIFYRINGAYDKCTYINELISFNLELKASKRRFLSLNREIPLPTTDEIADVNRKNYNSAETALSDLSHNIIYANNNQLQQLMRYEFISVLLKEAEAEKLSLNRLINDAVYVLCWLKRYQSALLSNWSVGDISCFVMLGGCKNNCEAMFVKLISKLPVDVIILVPDLNMKCCLTDSRLKEFNYDDSLSVSKFPDSNSTVSVGTTAYHAERELDTLMYQNSGMYRNRQYSKANTVILKTMYEEIAILWDQELKYRPSFSTENNEVTIPVILSKVSGIKDRNVTAYWQSVKALITPDTVVMRAGKYGSPEVNQIKQFAVSFWKNGKLLRSKIKECKYYKYTVLRNEVQEYIFDKIETLINRRLIKGTFENGTEYTIISSLLNIDQKLIRKIQNFDFTKKNPKLIYINTGENIISFEEAVVIAFLSLIGFDVVFFIPTGYQNIEEYYTQQIIEEHQIGEYVYDLQIPDFSHISNVSRQPWHKKLFRRGV